MEFKIEGLKSFSKVSKDSYQMDNVVKITPTITESILHSAYQPSFPSWLIYRLLTHTARNHPIKSNVPGYLT